MKTTLNLNDALLTEAKAYAEQQHTSLTRLIEEGLQLRLRKGLAPARRVLLPVYGGQGGLIVGVNALRNRAVLDAADHDVSPCRSPNSSP